MVAKSGFNLSLFFVLSLQLVQIEEDALTDYSETVTDVLLAAGFQPQTLLFDGEEQSDYYDYDDIIESPENNKVRRAQTLCKKGRKFMNFTKPRFKTKPGQLQKYVAGHIGHRMELKCPHRKGCPRGALTWWKDGHEVVIREQSGGLSGIYIQKNGALTIENNRPSDDGIYTCNVTNTEGSISHNIEVMSVARTVGRGPVVYHGQPGNHTVLVGSNLTLSCRQVVLDPASPSMIKWFQHHKNENGSWLDSDGLPNVTKVQDSHGKPPPYDAQQLVLENLTYADSGWWSCLVSNLFGNISRSGWVEVVETLEVGDVSKFSVIYWTVIGGGVVGVMLLMLLVVYCVKFRRAERDKLVAVEVAGQVARWTKRVIVERGLEREGMMTEPVVRVEHVETDLNVSEGGQLGWYEFSLDTDWELPRELLSVEEEVGRGQFGRVLRGVAHRCILEETLLSRRLVAAGHDVNDVVVAVKMLKEGAAEEELVNMVRELEVMKIVGSHINVVSLLGVCTQPVGQPLLAVLEYAEHGNLRDYLRHRSGLGEEQVCLRQMFNISWQVGKGMEFLAGRGCVHRDLAARNVLVTANKIMKVADFGLARDLDGGDYYRSVGDVKLPVLWMSPESLFQRICTTNSDVWSFGILLWEIVTWGERPYSGVATEKLLDLIKEGYRMPRPSHCPDFFYQIMSDCWNLEPTCRPHWSSLVDSLHDLHHSTLPGTYLRLIPPEVMTPCPSPVPSLNQVDNSSELVININRPVTQRRVSEESGYMGSIQGATNDSSGLNQGAQSKYSNFFP